MNHKEKIVSITLILILLAALLAACGGASGAAGSDQQTIAISGAFALYPMVTRWAEEYQKAHPNVQFDIQAGGAGKGMSDVLAGAVDIAMVSREIRDEESAQGATGFGVAKDAVVPTISANNPNVEAILTHGITPELGASIWLTAEITTWGQFLGTNEAAEIHVYTRSDASGAAEMWAKYLGGEAQEELLGIAVDGDPGVAQAVREDLLGFGYNNIGFTYDLTTGQPIEGLRVVPLDLNGDGQIADDENFYATLADLLSAIQEGRFPSPPSRALYLVTKGAPNPAAEDFIRWVLTEGQQFINAAGYVQLPDDQVEAALEQLGD